MMMKDRIHKADIEAAIKTMRKGKATGQDEISAEILAALDSKNLTTIAEICNDIYHTGSFPKDMRQSIFVPIPKRPNAHNCSDFRTISMMSHMTKHLLKIIMASHSGQKVVEIWKKTCRDLEKNMSRFGKKHVEIWKKTCRDLEKNMSRIEKKEC